MRDKQVLDFLLENPQFVRRHLSELTRLLRLAERDVVDLTGRQVVALRDENTELTRQLREWYQNAADNEAILRFLHRLGVALVTAQPTKGSTARVLQREMGKLKGVGLCRLVDLKDKRGMLTEPDRIRLEEAGGALRTDKPLASLARISREEWAAYLYVPVMDRNSMRAVVVNATRSRTKFPQDARADYAINMAEIVGAALAREK